MANGRIDPRRPFVVAHGLGLLALVLWSWLTGGSPAASAAGARGADASAGPAGEVAAALPSTPAPTLPAIPDEVDVRKAQLDAATGRYVQKLADGGTVVLSLDPVVQQAAEKALQRHPIQFGSVVAFEPRTGRLLGLAEAVGDADASGPRPAFDASHPAASIFKLVSATALLDSGAVPPGRKVCVHGGRRGLTREEIRGGRRKDDRCRRFSEALGHSDNTIFARLAYQHLEPAALTGVAKRLGFGRDLGAPWPVARSEVTLPADGGRDDLARTAAGFWHSTLSPVHAALLTAAIANDGVLMAPRYVDAWLDADGEPVIEPRAKVQERMMSARTANVLTRMMVETTTEGTARRAFSERRDWPHQGRVEVASKTGSLTRYKPHFTSYSWFVAFAPADDPKIAVASLVGNPEKWYVKAIHVVRETLSAYLSAELDAPRERRIVAAVERP